jgi:hypothetical protein
VNDLPSITDLLVIAPLATMVVLIVGIGFYFGQKSQQGHIETLKTWIEQITRGSS